MNSLSLMWSQYGKVIKVIMSPRELTRQVFYYVLKVTKSGLTIHELCKMACNNSNEVREYIGDKWDIEHNHKLKPVINNLINDSHIKRIGEKPMVLKYFENTEIIKSFNSDLLSDASYVSDGNSDNNITVTAVSSQSLSPRLEL